MLVKQGIKKKNEMITMKKNILGMKEKSFLLISLHVFLAFFIISGTLICYLLITDPRLIHTHGWQVLFSFLAAIFSIFVGLKLYRGASNR